MKIFSQDTCNNTSLFELCGKSCESMVWQNPLAGWQLVAGDNNHLINTAVSRRSETGATTSAWLQRTLGAGRQDIR